MATLRNLTFGICMATAILIAATMATPIQRYQQQHQRHVQAKIARQIEAKAAVTPYPAAGFRPRIPFELPNERQPKAAAEPTTPATTIITLSSSSTTVAAPAAPPADVDFIVTTQLPPSLVTSSVIVTTSDEFSDVDDNEKNNDNNERTPADTYGAPNFSYNNKNNRDKNNDSDNSSDTDSDSSTATEIEVDNTVEVIAAPAEDFQPPSEQAAADFVAPTPDTAAADGVDADVDAKHVVDFPAVDAPFANEGEAGISSVDLNIKLSPASTYGPPTVLASDGNDDEEEINGRHQPADTYGAPGASDTFAFVAGVDSEVTELAASSAENQVEILGDFDGLKNGRLIFVPGDGSNLRQIYFAEIQLPATRSRSDRNGRLTRF